VTKPTSVLDLSAAAYAAAKAAAIRPTRVDITPAAPPTATDMTEEEWREARFGAPDARGLTDAEYQKAKGDVLRDERLRKRR
jgi:hypothetical protein